MISKKSIVISLLSLVFILQSCKENSKLQNILDNEEPTTTLIGNKHILEEDGIQLQLPEDFKRLSVAEYSKILNQKKNRTKFNIEREELKNVRSLNGNSYIFFNEKNNSSYYINTIPYSEIKKDDAQKLLGIIRQNQNDVSKKSKVKFDRLTAKFKSTTGAQIFKAIFKAEFEKTKNTQYQHSYFINSNEKSVLLTLITSKEINFDKYIEKMIF
ncbi:MAG: hypothetical protein HKP48_11525 [Winogradskyella sp.]|uniref:hypothetical protein n=1 Tax=Winogradskyella sp. TaxID=1883156 RepID=UPI0017FDC72D|nr:hypothetical protein [Winogradskyella sp.]MBT8245502.1 hypothetical protein [Winogradskyella sp.]NNK23887.1 hypothetical protein [Winogradskyella sp.]